MLTSSSRLLALAGNEDSDASELSSKFKLGSAESGFEFSREHCFMNPGAATPQEALGSIPLGCEFLAGGPTGREGVLRRLAGKYVPQADTHPTLTITRARGYR